MIVLKHTSGAEANTWFCPKYQLLNKVFFLFELEFLQLGHLKRGSHLSLVKRMKLLEGLISTFSGFIYTGLVYKSPLNSHSNEKLVFLGLEMLIL